MEITPNLLQQDLDIATDNLSLKKKLANLKENLDEKWIKWEKAKKTI